MRLGALRFTSHSAGFVAFERGYFAEAGIDLEFEVRLQRFVRDVIADRRLRSAHDLAAS